MAVSPEQHARSFDARVAALASEAAQRSPGFRRRLDAAGLQPQELGDVAALDRLPVLTKDELLEHQLADPPFGGLLADDAPVTRVFQSPGPLYEPELAGGDHWRWREALEAAGFTADDVVLNAFGYHLSPAGAMFESACLAMDARVVPAGVGNRDLQVRAAADLGATAFVGPPSYGKALLEAAEQAGVTLRFERAFVSAEPLPPSLRAWLAERIPVVRQGFGTAEAGNLGYECEALEGLHVPTDALVQVCDLTTGAARHDGGEGQLVATLFSADYPIVRFATGDLSAWLTEPCRCGRPTPRIAGWLGRVGDAVKVKGMFLHPRQVQGVLGPLAGVAGYRMVIDRVDHRDVLRCEFVADADADDGVDERVRRAVRDGLRFNVEVARVASLPEGGPIDDRRTWD